MIVPLIGSTSVIKSLSPSYTWEAPFLIDPDGYWDSLMMFQSLKEIQYEGLPAELVHSNQTKTFDKFSL